MLCGATPSCPPQRSADRFITEIGPYAWSRRFIAPIARQIHEFVSSICVEPLVRGKRGRTRMRSS
jgi:hypothetical protein